MHYFSLVYKVYIFKFMNFLLKQKLQQQNLRNSFIMQLLEIFTFLFLTSMKVISLILFDKLIFISIINFHEARRRRCFSTQTKRFSLKLSKHMLARFEIAHYNVNLRFYCNIHDFLESNVFSKTWQLKLNFRKRRSLYRKLRCYIQYCINKSES